MVYWRTSKGTITKSYVQGSVDGENNLCGLAGLTGRTSNPRNIHRSYSTGAVTGNGIVGVLVAEKTTG